MCIRDRISTLTGLVSGLFRKKIARMMEETMKPDQCAKNMAQIKQMLEAHMLEDKQRYETLERVANGSLASLRNTILYLSNKFIKRGYMTKLDKQNLIDMYEAYHDLGGDTYATDEFEKAMAVPVHDR